MQPTAANARDRATSSKRERAKHKVAGELRELLINALYLALFLCAFTAYRALITGELLHKPVYVHLGTSMISALIIAKLITLGGWLNLGGRSGSNEPIIARVLYRSLIYSVFVIALTIVEKTVEGLFHGKSVGDSMRVLAHLGWDEIGARAIVILLALIPFFAFRELADQEGRESVYTMFFHRRTTRPSAEGLG
jgi:hypothetical protein